MCACACGLACTFKRLIGVVKGSLFVAAWNDSVISLRIVFEMRMAYNWDKNCRPPTSALEGLSQRLNKQSNIDLHDEMARHRNRWQHMMAIYS